MLRLLEIFFLKNSSPFFLKPWRVRASNINILLIGAIKHYNFFYCHFLLRPFLSKIFAGPFHQAKAESSSRTVHETKDGNDWKRSSQSSHPSKSLRQEVNLCSTEARHCKALIIINAISKSRYRFEGNSKNQHSATLQCWIEATWLLFGTLTPIIACPM